MANVNYAELEFEALNKLKWMYENTNSVPFNNEVYVTIDNVNYCVRFEEITKGQFRIEGYKSC